MSRVFSLSLVVPFYNEGIQIVKTYLVLSEMLKKNNLDYELIFVNDGSVDKGCKELSLKMHDDKRAKLVTYSPNQGRGYAVRQGFEVAKKSLIGYIDSDLEIKPDYILECLKNIKGFDGVVASKHLPGSKVKTRFLRRIASKFFNWWIRLVLGSRISDHQAGLKIFKSFVVKNVLPKVRQKGWLFDIEFLYNSQKYGYTINQLPINIEYGSRLPTRASFFIDFVNSLGYVVRLKYEKT